MDVFTWTTTEFTCPWMSKNSWQFFASHFNNWFKANRAANLVDSFKFSFFSISETWSWIVVRLYFKWKSIRSVYLECSSRICSRLNPWPLRCKESSCQYRGNWFRTCQLARDPLEYSVNNPRCHNRTRPFQETDSSKRSNGIRDISRKSAVN